MSPVLPDDAFTHCSHVFAPPYVHDQSVNDTPATAADDGKNWATQSLVATPLPAAEDGTPIDDGELLEA